MNVSYGNIEITKITTGRIFDCKENERFKDRTTEVLSGYKAVEFIESRPFYLSQRRPDLFCFRQRLRKKIVKFMF